MRSQLLPSSLEDVVDALGIDAALALVESFGGVRIYVPEVGALHDEHPIVVAIGEQQAAELCRRFAREILQVPKCEVYLRALRDQQIREALKAGARPKDLARRHRLTERQIFRIKADTDTDDGQPSLF